MSRFPLLGNASIYTLSNLANAAIPFVLLPVLTRYLDPASYGLVAMFQVLTGLSAPFVGLNVHGAIARQFYRSEVDHPSYVGTALGLLALSSVGLGIVLGFVGAGIESLFAFPRHTLWAVWVFITGQFLILTTLTLWQVRQRPIPYALFSLTKSVADAVLSLIFVVSLDWGWQGRVAGQSIAVVLVALLGVAIIVRVGFVRFRFVPDMARNALRFGAPLIPHAFGAWAIQMTDRVLLTRMVGLEPTGVYLAGLQISLVLLVVQDAFNKAWIPHLFGVLERGSAAELRKVVRFTYAYGGTLIAVAVALGLLAPTLIALLLPKTYAEAGIFVVWLALAHAFNGIYKMVAGYVFYAERTEVLTVITFATALINVAVSYLLIRTVGPLGAALGTAVAWLIAFLLTWWLANRLHPMPWRSALEVAGPPEVR